LNDERNLLPSLKIVNHYKRGKDLTEFRHYIKSLQCRIDKLPKYTKVNRVEAEAFYGYKATNSQRRTAKRAIYLKEVAAAFGITPETPFSGKFFFETTAGNGATAQQGKEKL
jgi:hypothetical protein